MAVVHPENLGGKRYGRRRTMFLPWKMPKIFQYRHMQVMFSDQNTNGEPFDLEAEIMRQVENGSETDPETEAPQADVSLPNLVDLSVSTPVKASPEVKQEPVSMASAPSSLPMLETDLNRKRTRSPKLMSSASEITQSVTLESETRSADTTASLMTDHSEVRTPTPAPVSPPAKIRRSTRNQNKN